MSRNQLMLVQSTVENRRLLADGSFPTLATNKDVQMPSGLILRGQLFQPSSFVPYLPRKVYRCCPYKGCREPVEPSPNKRRGFSRYCRQHLNHLAELKRSSRLRIKLAQASSVDIPDKHLDKTSS